MDKSYSLYTFTGVPETRGYIFLIEDIGHVLGFYKYKNSNNKKCTGSLKNWKGKNCSL